VEYEYGRVLKVTRQIEAGATFINSHSFESLNFRMPVGGVKQSGIGREFNEKGLEEYVENHSIRIVKKFILNLFSYDLSSTCRERDFFFMA
jgi:acyl-CoA reductase-like NAD-dependent aldehyde dehydrogenase